MTTIGIVGLPQAGATTVFNALTGAHREVGGYHGTAHVQVGVVKVPDERMGFLADLFEPDKVTPTAIEFEDVEGLFAGTGGAREVSGPAMSALRESDGILVVLRCFEDPSVLLPQGEIDPLRDYRAIRDELLLADLAIVENRLKALQKDMRRAGADREALASEQEVLERCRDALEEESGLQGVEMSPAQEKMLRSYAFLTLKPVMCVLNIGEAQIGAPPRYAELESTEPPPLAFCSELEMELMDLEDEDRREFMAEMGIEESARGRVVGACYRMLNLVTFFTCAHEQLRAWPIRAGSTAVEAAGRIHSDMAEGFIRAEVVNYEDLAECGSLREARDRGKLRLEGRDYEVQEGDLITFRFNA